MRKLMSLICAGVLVSAVCAGSTACNDDNDPSGNGGGLPGNAIQTVAVSDQVAEFLNQNHSSIANHVLPLWDGEEDLKFFDTCVMINSVDELPETDANGNPIDYSLLDFDNHTLIVGRYLTANTSYEFTSQNIIIDTDKIIMNTTIERVREIHISVIEFHGYWGMYPKLPQLPIRVNRNVIR